MTVFVSYARRDNPLEGLKSVEMAVSRLGNVYIDDVHGCEAVDRLTAVETALGEAVVFVGVATPHYLQTIWTRREFACAIERRIPIIALMPDGRLVDQDAVDWPWHDVATGFTHADSGSVVR
jgi:hypothetical protein